MLDRVNERFLDEAEGSIGICVDVDRGFAVGHFDVVREAIVS